MKFVSRLQRVREACILRRKQKQDNHLPWKSPCLFLLLLFLFFTSLSYRFGFDCDSSLILIHSSLDYSIHLILSTSVQYPSYYRKCDNPIWGGRSSLTALSNDSKHISYRGDQVTDIYIQEKRTKYNMGFFMLQTCLFVVNVFIVSLWEQLKQEVICICREAGVNRLVRINRISCSLFCHSYIGFEFSLWKANDSHLQLMSCRSAQLHYVRLDLNILLLKMILNSYPELTNLSISHGHWWNDNIYCSTQCWSG